MNNVEKVDLRFDKEALRVLIEAFDYVRKNFDNPKIIDTAMLMMTIEDHEIEEMINSLRKAADSESASIISMNFNQWVLYETLFILAEREAPLAREGDEKIWHSLTDYHDQLDKTGLLPTGPQTRTIA